MERRSKRYRTINSRLFRIKILKREIRFLLEIQKKLADQDERFETAFIIHDKLKELNALVMQRGVL